MCGRSSLTSEPGEFLASQGAPAGIHGFRPRFNIAPSQDQWALLRSPGGALEVRPLKWGLIPSWAKDASVGSRMINARAESVAEKPSYKGPLRTHRCLILADGYYEWTESETGRVPMRFELAGRRTFAFAGLWATWGKTGDPVHSCTIITTAAEGATMRYHHRMPVILDGSAATTWLTDGLAPSDALELLRPWPGDDLRIFEVSRIVNSPANDRPECIEPVARDG